MLDVESTYDCTTTVCNKLIPSLMRHRNSELLERRQKRQEEEKRNTKPKQKPEDTNNKTETDISDVNTPVMYTPRLRYGFLEGYVRSPGKD